MITDYFICLPDSRSIRVCCVHNLKKITGGNYKFFKMSLKVQLQSQS